MKILWVDDEIELLKSHILFLKQRNYEVEQANNGPDAIDLVEANRYDIVFLDENMPGLTGLETLAEIKLRRPNLPVVMITKSEEEYIMEEAIGSKIADYLIKPVNPNQILLSLKKNLDHTRLVSEKTTSSYQQEFRNISLELASVNSFEEWSELYKKLIFWEIELDNISDIGLLEILESQKHEANSQFFKFIQKNYKDSLKGENGPIYSHDLFRKIIRPRIQNSSKGMLWIIIDNLRYDQFRVLEPFINKHFIKEEEYTYYSILPTATQYARNAIFAGMMPSEIEQTFPQYWKNDTDEGGKNLFENELLTAQIKTEKLQIKHEYHKISSLKAGKNLSEDYNSSKQNDLTVVVYNFVDILSHSKTEMEVIKELAGDDKSYRSLTESWFRNSPLYEIIKKASELGQKLVVTTDHGTINCKHPSKVIGDKNISSNLRYKTGKSLSFQDKDVFEARDPKEIFLPSISINSPFIFAKENLFFAYPNNFNHFVKYYKNTYQHGGISLEEMIIPCAVYNPKS